MQIVKGKIDHALKCIVYGPEGIGKSTFTSHFPNPLFSDTEGSTKNLDVARLPRPTSWMMLIEQVVWVRANPTVCNTFVIDTADWAEQLCAVSVCAKAQKAGIEDFGWGKGYTYLAEEFGRLLNTLEDLIERGINVVVTAHAQMRKFEQPEEMGSYDRWELKLQKKTAPLLMEWADMVLFANYKTLVVNVDGQGALKGKNKAQGNKRVMYTEHQPSWDAKNRHGLKDELPFDFKEIAHCIPGAGVIQAVTASIPTFLLEKPTPASIEDPRNAPEGWSPPLDPRVSPCVAPTAPIAPVPEPVPIPNASMRPVAAPAPEAAVPVAHTAQKTQGYEEGEEYIPKPLLDLMREHHVMVYELRDFLIKEEFYPEGTPLANFDPKIFSEWVMSVWPKVLAAIESNPNRLPF